MIERKRSNSRCILWVPCVVLLASPASLFVVSAKVQSAKPPASLTRVGPNVLVSRGQSNNFMREVLLSADPTNPNRLLGCGIAIDPSRGELEGDRVIVYLSTNGGKTWRPTLQTGKDTGDPACAFGRGGLAILAVLRLLPNPHASHPSGYRMLLAVYRSTDGGSTWSQPEDFPMNFQGIDRESVTIDTTNAKYKNTIYISGTSSIQDFSGGVKNGLGVWISRDGGKTFLGPLKRADADGHYVLQTGNSAILSDGTLVTIFGDIRKLGPNHSIPNSSPGNPNAALRSVRTEPGGESLSEAAKVANFYMINIWRPDGLPPSHSTPTLAVDPSDGPFEDRLYAVWADDRDGRGAIRLSYSADKGKTWSRSVVIDDVPGPVTGGDSPSNSQPTVAVNKAGVVLVTWFDRRDNPDGLGWYIRARASLDGGQTWLPSFRVSTQPNVLTPRTKLFVGAAALSPQASPDAQASVNPIHVGVYFDSRQFFAGDYAGLAADASGTFHAFWTDDRTGLPQIWTAPIIVDGTAVPNGNPSLAKLQDVSPDVQLKVVSSIYDRDSGTVTIGIQLRNTSSKTILAPIKLRLLNLTSSIGTPSAANADNGIAEPDALWDFSSLLKGGILGPKQTSATKQFVFRVNDPRPFFNGKVIRTLDLLDFNARVLAGGEEAAKPTPQK